MHWGSFRASYFNSCKREIPDLCLYHYQNTPSRVWFTGANNSSSSRNAILSTKYQDMGWGIPAYGFLCVVVPQHRPYRRQRPRIGDDGPSSSSSSSIILRFTRSRDRITMYQHGGRHRVLGSLIIMLCWQLPSQEAFASFSSKMHIPILYSTLVLLLATEPQRHEGRQVYCTGSSTTTTDYYFYCYYYYYYYYYCYLLYDVLSSDIWLEQKC